MKLLRQRKVAVDLWLERADTSSPMLLDYQLDTLLRELYKLPERPDGTLPYEGWMIGRLNEQEGQGRKKYIRYSLCKKWEGLKLEAYLCPAGVWTIGHGHTAKVKPGQKITLEQAEELLAEDMKIYEEAVTRLVKVKLTDNQFNALCSFAFNCGIGALSKSTLLKKLNRGQYTEAADEFLRWVRGGGRTLPGLVARRKEERKLFLTP